MSIILNRLTDLIRIYPSGNYLETHGYNFATRLDYTGANLTYVGFAHPGSSNNDPSWLVLKLYYNSNDDISGMRYADGNSKFDNVWDNRTSLTYS